MELLAVVFGLLLGVLTGLVPGISVSSIVLLLLPFLYGLDLLSLFLFYIVLVSTSQYYSSISSIVYGVAGEMCSMPAVVHGHPLYKLGQGSKILALTSTSSFIASMFGVILIINTYFFTENLILFSLKM